MRLFKRKDPNLEDELRKLEVHLRAALQPVTVRPQFIKDLKSRLTFSNFPPIQKQSHQRLSKVLLLVGGIIGSLMVLIAGIRGLVSLIFIIGHLIQRMSKNFQRQEPTPA
jgi:hypothetical protein